MPFYALDGVSPELPADGEAWLAPDAQVIGRVRIGREASLWFGAVARGDNALIDIGARANIQDGSILHTDEGIDLVIGEGVTVGHRVMLHGCTIGSNALVGIGATVLNHAVIGRDSLVGAHALVTEGKSFPERSLIVGAPAKVVRQLTDEEVARLAWSADHYVANWRRYAAGLRQVLKSSGD
jgi:carbonic anhydrase/acetyltransferase-like protein (isoleucine patch superfamily)